MLAVEEDVVVYSMGYLGIRLGVHGRGDEAGITSVGEDGGGEVVKKGEVIARATDSEMARRSSNRLMEQEKVQAGAATPKGSLLVYGGGTCCAPSGSPGAGKGPR